MATNEPGKKISDFKSGAWQHENVVRVYLESTESKPLEQTLFSFMGDIYKLHCEPDMNILDVGCGPGRLTIALHDHGCKMVGSDVSQAMLDALIKNKGDREIETRCGDGHSLAAADGEFDAVVSMDFMPHFEDWAELLAEKARCCRQGGYVLFNFQSKEHAAVARDTGKFDYTHIYSSDNLDNPEAYYAEYAAEELLTACEKAGLDLIRLYPYGLFWSHYNFMIGHAVGPDALQELNEEMSRRFQSEEVREFAYWFERTVVRHLPAFMTHEHVTVCRKR